MRGFFASLQQVDESIPHLSKGIRSEAVGCRGLARVIALQALNKFIKPRSTHISHNSP